MLLFGCRRTKGGICVWEAGLSAAVQLASGQSLIFLTIGVVFGLIMGILPGLGGIITVSLLMPFVYGVDPAPAFALLLGAFSAVTFGGAVTSILLNVPGNSDNVATCWDGYPLTRQGEGGRALFAAAFSCMLGGLAGAVILIAAIPVVRPLVLTFGPSEYFVLSMMGIAVIALLTGRSVVKGLAAGGLGLLLSFVGAASVSGDYRYTFGLLYLWDGIEFASFVIGFFAIAEMISLYINGTPIAEGNTNVRASAWNSFLEVLAHWRTLVRSSIIGYIIGIIPGVGGAVGNIVAYGYELRSAKDPSRFGKGAIEGVIAPSAADNSKDGASLIPTIAFGVPGSSVMALMLGAFLILGLQPGIDMLTTHLDQVFVMAWTLVLGNLLTTAIGVVFASHLARIAQVRSNIIVPITLVICFLGAYSVNFSLNDIILAIVFGLIGYGFIYYDFPRQTLVLGLVLGIIAEKNFHLAYQVFGPAFLFRPYSLALIVISLIIFGLPILQMRKRNKEATHV